MRKIKFRAWLDESKKMMYQEEQYLCSFIRRFITEKCWEIHESYLKNDIGYYLMQYTWLKDKFNNEIFEDDIIKINTHFHHIVPLDFDYKYENEKGSALYKVFWNNYKCKFELIYLSCNKIEPSSKVLNIYNAQERIWNIYENPKLLKS